MDLSCTVPALSKLRGCMLGGLAGDCLGQPFEFSTFTDNSEFSKRVQQFVRNFAHGTNPNRSSQEHCRPGEFYTDDTALARVLLNSLITCHGFDAKSVARGFTEIFFNDVRDRCYGGHIKQVFVKLRSSNFEDPFGPAACQFDGEGSYGNGGAMRVLAVPVYYATSFEDMLQVAIDQCRVTHTHPHAIMGAILIAACIYIVLHESPDTIDQITFIDTILRVFVEQYQNVYRQMTKMEENVYFKKLNLFKTYLSKKTPLSKIAPVLGNGEPAADSVPSAIYSFVRCMNVADDHELEDPVLRTIVYAISFGYDTDTIATMAGAMAGAFYGDETLMGLTAQMEGCDFYIDASETIFRMLNEKKEQLKG